MLRLIVSLKIKLFCCLVLTPITWIHNTLMLSSCVTRQTRLRNVWIFTLVTWLFDTPVCGICVTLHSSGLVKVILTLFTWILAPCFICLWVLRSPFRVVRYSHWLHDYLMHKCVEFVWLFLVQGCFNLYLCCSHEYLPPCLTCLQRCQFRLAPWAISS